MRSCSVYELCFVIVCEGLYPNFMMADKFEQRACINFCFKLGKLPTETFAMLQKAFEEHSLSRTQVFEWYPHFEAGRTSLEDVRSG